MQTEKHPITVEAITALTDEQLVSFTIDCLHLLKLRSKNRGFAGIALRDARNRVWALPAVLNYAETLLAYVRKSVSC